MTLNTLPPVRVRHFALIAVVIGLGLTLLVFGPGLIGQFGGLIAVIALTVYLVLIARETKLGAQAAAKATAIPSEWSSVNRRLEAYTAKLAGQLQDSVRSAKEANGNSDAASLAHTLGAAIDEMRVVLDRDAALIESEKLRRDRSNLNFFSPTLIPASRVIERPSAHSAGRLAADQVMEDDGRWKLNLLMQPDTDLARNIQLIGGQSTCSALESVANVDLLIPGQLPVEVDPRVSYVVVDLRRLEWGPWSQILNPVRTGEFRELCAYLDAARRAGCVVIVCQPRQPEPLSASLSTHASINVIDGETDLQWELEENMPILSTLLSIEELDHE